MRFRLSEFEQHFNPGGLKGGLRLIRKQQPVLIARSHKHYAYLVGKYTVSFEKHGPEIHHCHCDCRQNYCEHLAAVMFLQNGHQLPAGTKKLVATPTTRSEERFRSVFSSLEAAWKKITSAPQPVSAQVAAFLKKMEAVSQKEHFATDMAILAAMSLCGRSTLTDERLSALTQKIILRNFIRGGTRDEDAMYLCLTECLRTNDRAMTGRFSSLLPLYLLNTRNMFHLEEIRSLIERRHFRKYHSDLFDELLIARTMLHHRTAELEGKTVKLTRNSPAEAFIARARLLFAAHEMDAAWNLLDELRRSLREKMPLSYFDFLSYLISLCDALREPARKVEISEEMILCSPYLSPSFAAGYIASLPASRRNERIRILMQRIVASNAEGAADKILILSMESGQTEFFLASHLRNRVRFPLLHELFSRHKQLLLGPSADLYFERLCDALSKTDFALPRVQMLSLSATALSKLPRKRARKYHTRVSEFLESRPVLRQHLPAWENRFSRRDALVLE